MKQVPYIKTGLALNSLRDSGFSIDSAIAETVDNSIEANANEIDILLTPGESGKRKQLVSSITIVDDGEGMTLDVLQSYPQLGYSTRYMSTNTIGKFGVGAKLAAISVAKRFDVWSRRGEDEPWLHTYFDLDEMMQQEKDGGNSFVPVPKELRLPKDLGKDFKEPKQGTIVRWSEIDRLAAGKHASSVQELTAQLSGELARMFRYYINGGIELRVNGEKLQAYDPLFMMETSMQNRILKDYYTELCKKDERVSAEKIKNHYEPYLVAEEDIKIGGSVARLRITLFPDEVVRRRGQGGDTLATKLKLQQNQGAISFVRLSREVSYTNVPRIFPRGVDDADRHIGIEVSFNPELDEYFGVRNVKRGVEPDGVLRKKIRDLLKVHLNKARALLEEVWGKASKESKKRHGEYSGTTEAAAKANKTMPKGRVSTDATEPADRALDDLARDVVGDDEKARQSYIAKHKDKPFIVEEVNFPGNSFVDIQHLANQLIIRINERHPFFREVWEPIKSISEQDPGAISGEEALKVCRRSLEALTLLLISYGKATSMKEDPIEAYNDLTNYWGMFLSNLMKTVKDTV